MASIQKEAEEAAERVRSSFWMDGRLPVDPVEIARSMGINVRQADLPPAVSAAIVKRAGKDPVILLHKDDSPNRKRFSCAHELGHYIRNAGDTVMERVDFRDPKSATGLDPEEQFANRFAGALLMPASDVRALSSFDVWDAARHFGVSSEAMRVRRETLGV